MHTDGASNVAGSGISVVLVAPSRFVFELSARLEGKTTNNEAEYEAVLYRLELAQQLDVRFFRAFVDSAIIAGQISEVMNVVEPRLKLYLDKVKALLHSFEGFIITRIPCEHNQDADRLAKIGSHGDRRRPIEVRTMCPENVEAIAVLEEAPPSWMQEILSYLKDAILLVDKKEARKLRNQAVRHYLLNDILYRLSFKGGADLNCLPPSQSWDVLAELH